MNHMFQPGDRVKWPPTGHRGTVVGMRNFSDVPLMVEVLWDDDHRRKKYGRNVCYGSHELERLNVLEIMAEAVAPKE